MSNNARNTRDNSRSGSSNLRPNLQLMQGDGNLLELDVDSITRSILSDVTSEVDVDEQAIKDEEAPSSHGISNGRQEDQSSDTEWNDEEVSRKKEKKREPSSLASVTTTTTSPTVDKDAELAKGCQQETRSTRSGWMLFRGMNPFPTARAEKGATRRVKAQQQQRRSFRINPLAALAEGDEDNVTAASTHDTRGTSISSLSSHFYNHQGDFLAGRACRVALLVLLCLLVLLVIIVVILMVTGGVEGLLDITGIFNGDDGEESFDHNDEYERLRAQGKLRDVLPSSSLVSSLDDSSPQSKASRWLQNHPLLLQDEEEVPSWRIRQLFAMATFYYAFGGDDWPERQRSQWLNYDVHECQWGDVGVAVIHPFTYAYDYWGRTSCHESSDGQSVETKRGRLRDLNLNWMVTESSRTTTEDPLPKPITGPVRMPEEIEFLTELETLGIENCGVTTDLSDLIPSQLSRMSHLKTLSFQNNNLHGRLPTTSSPWPSSLERLNIGHNDLAGPIPSQLGLLSTRLQELMLFENQLSGALPSELGGLQQLTGLSVIGNDLTGTIPIELSELSSLEFLYLNTNDIEGNVPSGVCQLPSLESIWVDCSVDCGTTCGDGVCQCPP